MQEFIDPVSPLSFVRPRPGDPRLGEWAEPCSGELQKTGKRHTVGIWGCPDDLGVTLNRGRAGAKEGPSAIRKFLYTMTPPMEGKWESTLRLVDLGTLIPSTQILETHERCSNLTAHFGGMPLSLIALGGGHDFAAPCFSGFVRGRGLPRAKVALINVDPHLDVRPLENGQPHSGTPFRQILEAGTLDPARLVQFGTRMNRNHREGYVYCKGQGVRIESLDKIRMSRQTPQNLFKTRLAGLARTAGIVGVTIDMDCCQDTDGVSAPTCLGFSAWELCSFAFIAGQNPKVAYLEIAEVAPGLESFGRAARIASEIVFYFLLGRAGN